MCFISVESGQMCDLCVGLGHMCIAYSSKPESGNETPGIKAFKQKKPQRAETAS